ncbi:hypothetical protein [Xylophilus ampelinus]|uniref:hypothetical protein n=1 Tax=Xylophilus ampelinus TaxID=54067 RepID=UPI001F31AE9B|nr:hypothetical protein [Xylophilus ampelinus]
MPYPTSATPAGPAVHGRPLMRRAPRRRMARGRGGMSCFLAMLLAGLPAIALATRTAAQREGDTAAAMSAPADDAPAAPFKFTTGLYRTAGAGQPTGTGLDSNLRYQGGVGDLWVGALRAPVGDLSQLRGGWDRGFALGPLRLLPSVQWASGGFVGGSVNVEVGIRWYAGAGLGRTNLRNYVNLNFDPNDAWMLSAGYRWSEGRYAGLQVVRDNREHPDQQHVHLVARLPTDAGHAVFVDLLDKRGSLDDGRYIHRYGASMTYSWPRIFVRLAYDPKVNFTPQNQWRLSVGTRF